MGAINVRSEIKPLKKVLLHRPGRELLNLTPDSLERLLFDDVDKDQMKDSDDVDNKKVLLIDKDEQLNLLLE